MSSNMSLLLKEQVSRLGPLTRHSAMAASDSLDTAVSALGREVGRHGEEVYLQWFQNKRQTYTFFKMKKH